MLNLQKPICKNLLTALALLTILFLTVFPQKPVNNLPIFNSCWFYPTTIAGVFNIASDNESFFYLSLSDGKLLSVNSETAEKSWETEMVGDIISTPLIDQKNVYIVTKHLAEPNNDKGNDSGNNISTAVVHSLGKTTGIAQWQTRLASTDKVYLYNSENFIILILANGDVYSVAKVDGRIGWIKSLGSAVSSRPLKKASEIILGTSDRRIIALSLNDGGLIEKFEIPAPPTVIIEDKMGDNLIVADKKGILSSLNKRKKTRNWNYRLGAEISSVKLTARGLLACSFDNFVYLISEKSGKLIWKKRLPGRIAAEPQIRDNNFIITSVDESEALVIELSSGKLVDKIVLEDENFFTGDSTQSKNLFIYTTRKGIFGFSLREEGCRASEK